MKDQLCEICTTGTPSEARPWFRDNCPKCKGTGKKAKPPGEADPLRDLHLSNCWTHVNQAIGAARAGGNGTARFIWRKAAKEFRAATQPDAL